MTNQYIPLFKIPILHHYFLDEGNEVYGDDLPSDRMEENMAKYKVSDYLKITPSVKTARLLKNYRAQFVLLNDSILVMVKADPSDDTKPFIEFSTDFVLDFLIEIKDTFFENYTKININREKLVMISNVTPTESTEDDRRTVKFSKLSEYGASGTSSNLKIDLDKDISPSETIGKFGFIRIHPRGEADELHFTDASMTNFIDPTPNETITFKNRKTFWRYVNTSDGTVAHTTGSKKPLTKYGHIEIEDSGTEYPNPSVNLIIKEDGKFYSETFV